MTLLVLDIECPKCGTKPNRRIFPKTREKHVLDEDAEPVETWRCQHCGETNVITAAAYKTARPPNGRA